MNDKNIACFLPRPKPDHYRGGMPLGAEEFLIDTAKDILSERDEDLKILNLFCGMTKQGIRVDLNPKVNPDYLLDAHTCSKTLLDKEGKFDIILADPPYSNREAWKLYPNINLPKLCYDVWTWDAKNY